MKAYKPGSVVISVDVDELLNSELFTDNSVQSPTEDASTEVENMSVRYFDRILKKIQRYRHSDADWAELF